jgi:Spy/CpxP family protein refolding chaperone
MNNAHRDRQPVGRVVSTIGSLLVLAALTLATMGSPAWAASASWTQQKSPKQELSGAQAQQVKAVSQRLSSQSDAILRRYGVRRGTCSNASVSRLRAMGNELDRAFASARSQLSRVLSPSQLKQFTATYQQRRRAERARIVCGAAR